MDGFVFLRKQLANEAGRLPDLLPEYPERMLFRLSLPAKSCKYNLPFLFHIQKGIFRKVPESR